MIIVTIAIRYIIPENIPLLNGYHNFLWLNSLGTIYIYVLSVCKEQVLENYGKYELLKVKKSMY